MCVLAGLCLYTCAYLANPALFPKNLCLINIFELSSTSDSRSKQKSYIVHCCVYIGIFSRSHMKGNFTERDSEGEAILLQTATTSGQYTREKATRGS